MDMSRTIAPKSDQINADDLINGPLDIVVTKVSGSDSDDQPVNIYFEGDRGKPFRPCKSMRRVLVTCWGADAKEYVGRAMRLYRDPDVTFGGAKVGGIRISHLTHIDQRKTMALTASKAKRKPYTVEPFQIQTQGQDGPSAEEAFQTAKLEANKGMESFRAWYNTPAAKEIRHLIEKNLPELQKLCEAADRRGEDEDPFGLPPLEDKQTLSPEEEERVRREIDEQREREMAEG